LRWANMNKKIFKLIITVVIAVLIIGAAYIFLSDTNLFVKEKKVNLYFGTDDAMNLKLEKRDIRGRNLYLEAVMELIKGPTDPNLTKTIPDGTEVLNISKDGDIIVVDFNDKIVKNHWGGSTGERITVYSIVNTLGQFEKINKVKFLIEGEEVNTLVGHMDLSTPLEPNPELSQ